MPNWFTRVFGSGEESAQKSLPNASVISTVVFGNSIRSGSRGGTRELLAAFGMEPNLRRVVGKIGKEFGALQWHIYREAKSGAARAAHSKGLEFLSAVKAMVLEQALEELPQHPLVRLLQRPNPMHSGSAFMSLMQTWLDLVGEAGAVKERNSVGLGQWLEMWPVAPHWVRDVPDMRSPDATYKIQEPGRPARPVSQADMFWIRELDVSNPYGRGSGIGSSLADEIDTCEYAARYLKDFFYNDAKPPFFLGIRGIKDEAELLRAKEKFMQQHRGPHRAYEPHFYAGEIDLKELGKGLNDNSVMPLREQTRRAFGEVYGVPPEIIGDLSNSNRATAYESRRTFAENCLIPRAESWRQELQQLCDKEFGEGYVVGYDSPSPDDLEFKREMISTASWAFTRGEIRELAGYEDRGEVDAVFMVPAMLIAQRDGTEVPEEQPAVEPVPPPEPEPAAEEPPPEPEPVPGTAARSIVFNAAKAEKTQKKIDDILDALDPEHISAKVDPDFKDLVDEWGCAAMAEVGVKPAFNLLKPGVVSFLENASTYRIKGLVDGTTRTALQAQLAEGMAEGEGVNKIKGRIQAVFDDCSNRRAKLIARTETGRAANFATMEGYQQTGVVERKQWVATADDKTRDEHAALGAAEPIPLADPFTVGDAEAMYPGDFGDPELDCNCRCAVTSSVGEAKTTDMLRAEWKVFDRKLIPWETRIEKHLQEGFVTQRKALMAAADDVLVSDADKILERIQDIAKTITTEVKQHMSSELLAQKDDGLEKQAEAITKLAEAVAAPKPVPPPPPPPAAPPPQTLKFIRDENGVITGATKE